jgi:hypothetical protein
LLEPGNDHYDNFCTLLLTVVSADVFDLAVKTTAPISPEAPAVVDQMRAVPRDENAGQSDSENAA